MAVHTFDEAGDPRYHRRFIGDHRWVEALAVAFTCAPKQDRQPALKIKAFSAFCGDACKMASLRAKW